MSFQRRLALSLMEHAAAVMPADRKDWAEAMRAEFAVMPTDRDALAWAGGCVWASYIERIQPMDVLVKSLLRAFAVWLIVLAFVAVMILLHPMHSPHPQVWKLVRLLSVCYGGMFATLWVCELLIAGFWSAPGKILQKLLVRATAVWLWPFGLSVTMFVHGLTNPHIIAHIGADRGPWLLHWLWNWVTHYPVMFVAIFVPLLICELLIARYWRVRPVRAG